MTAANMEKSKSTNKGLKISIGILAALVILIATILFFVNQFVIYTIHGDSLTEAQKAAAKYLKGKEGLGADIEALAMTQEGDYLVVLFKDNESGAVGIVIFETLGIFDNKYKTNAVESWSLTKQIDVYNESGTHKWAESGNGSLIVVYGINTDIQAHSYKFVISGDEYSEVIENDYFVHIFLIDESTDETVNGNLYDAGGQVIRAL